MIRRQLNLKRRGFPPLVIGHRGAKGRAPENTLAAFEEGARLGADVIECDVHFSRDRQLVVIHDDTVDRTTNGFGLVRELTLAQLKALDAGRRQRIPSLEEVLDWLRPHSRMGIAIEIKKDLTVYPGIAEAVIDAVLARDLVSRTVVISFDYAILEEVKDLCRDLATGILFHHPLPDPIGTAVEVNADSVLPALHLLNHDLVIRAWNAGLAVFTWVANTEKEMEHAISFGVDGIASDYPDLLRSRVDARVKPLRKIG